MLKDEYVRRMETEEPEWLNRVDPREEVQKE